MQKDSLSPLFFVLCLNPLSRKFIAAYSKVAIKIDDDQYVSKHFLFIDDLKLNADREKVLKAMTEETEKFFEVVGLVSNRAKSATNCGACEETAVPLSANEKYKYFGITENRKSEVSRETYKRIHTEILKKV